MTNIKLAAAQYTPVFLDRRATLEKACHIIAEAGRKKVKLLVFPEAFFPAYPEWVWCIPPGKKALTNQVFEDLWQNAVTIPDGTTKKLCEAARKAGVFVVMGVNERNKDSGNGTLYNTIIYIDDKGSILGKHRKLVPTGGERLVWGSGDGSTLQAFDASFGRIGGLICWENYMPLARYAMYTQGVQIYVAPTWDYGDTWHSTLRHIAKEGGVFVIGACMPMRVKDIPNKYEFKSLYDPKKDWINPGDSCIVNPKGEIIAGPVKNKEELVIAEADLSLIRHAKWMLDTAGHYDRLDVFEFRVRDQMSKS